MRFDIFSILLSGCAAGVGLGIFFPAFFPETFFASLLVGIALFSVFFQEKHIVFVALFFLAAAAGVLFSEQKRSYWETLPDFPEAVSGNGRMISEVKEKGFFSEAEFRFDHCDNVCPKENIRLELPRTFEAVPGMSFSLSCVLEKPEETIKIDGRTLPWRMMLAARGIGYTCKPDQLDKISESGQSFQESLFEWKHRFLEALDQTIVPQYAPLAAGMLLGADDTMPEDERQMFVRAGLSHVTAVSGFNIVLVGGAFFLFAIGLGGVSASCCVCCDREYPSLCTCGWCAGVCGASGHYGVRVFYRLDHRAAGEWLAISSLRASFNACRESACHSI